MGSRSGLWTPVWESRAALVPEDVVFGLADVEVATVCAGEAPGRPAERTWSCPAAACFHGGFWAPVWEACAALVLEDALVGLAGVEAEHDALVEVELDESTPRRIAATVE